MDEQGKDDTAGNGTARNEVGGGASGNVVQARDIAGDVHLHQAAPDKPWPRPRQLPPDITFFTDRAEALATLDTLLAAPTDKNSAPVVISAIGGAGGMGKTSLAIRWGHRMRDRFPDGDLYVNLRGYDSGVPVTPEQALDGFLRALDVPGERIPQDLDARAALYRSLVADRRMLIIVDNAATAEQVRPLLPGTGTCLTLITSRSRLSGLLARQGGARIALDVLPPDQAGTLLRQVIGQERVDEEPDAVAELARRCAYLPLALRIAAERVADRPHLTVADLVDDLAEESERLDVLAVDDDENTQVRTVFSWSYRALSPEVARVFRLLGLHPGPDISLPAVAALTGLSIAKARRHLAALTNAHLLDEVTRNRYQFHDLLRTYAAECAEADEPADDRDAAARRLLEWYLHTAHAALRAMHPNHPDLPIDAPSAACLPLSFADQDRGMAWLDAEQTNLIAAIHYAASREYDTIACQLPLAVNYFLKMRYLPAQLIIINQLGLSSARRVGRQRNEFWTLLNIGQIYWDLLGRLAEAIPYYESAAAVARAAGYKWEGGTAIGDLGIVELALDRSGIAIEHFQEALKLRREIDDVAGQAVYHVYLGSALSRQRRFTEAIDEGRKGLTIHRRTGNRLGEGFALFKIGEICIDMGRFDDAVEHLRKSLDIYREFGYRRRFADINTALGEAFRGKARLSEARDAWHEALTILDDSGAPESDVLRARLAELESDPS
jgi:tetratricopeptide (TPR) repeat protein